MERTTGEKADSTLADIRELLKTNHRNAYPGAAIVFMPHTGGSPEQLRRYQPDKNLSGSQRGRRSAGVTSFASYLERQLQHRVAIYHGKMESRTTDAFSDAEDVKQHDFGDLSRRTRQSEQNAFIDGECDIMVSTKGFGMGIDKSNIRLIIHRTPPANLEAYAQEAGRAGRDGELADVILYYSPDQSEDTNDWGHPQPVPSDFDIQSFFLSERYIHREDVMVMRTFLRSVQREVSGYLYFTNDETIDFFEKCRLHPDLAGLELPFEWPDFQARRSSQRESEEHKAILDRGYMYGKKTEYIGKILQVLYRTRPNWNGSSHVALINSVQETGAQLDKPRILDANGIVESSFYFGKLLRSKCVTVSELRHWIDKCRSRNTIEFARHLGLSLSDTRRLFNDIRFSEGRLEGRNHNSWKPKLLDFKRIVTPRLGPAADKKSVSAWREYAGASRRASKHLAHVRKKKAHRKETTVDDWFSKKELNKPKGWEVLPGPALGNDDRFREYLDVFMELHDRRRQNDWASYERMLTGYVGVDEDGKLHLPRERNCLRAVMLGYLKTNEVVIGGNCHACSVCVPDLNFEHDMDKRRSCVIAIGDALVELLDRMEEDYVGNIPKMELTGEFFNTVEEERSTGHSVDVYVEGWTGRLLEETPGHQAALWLRLVGMVYGFIRMRPSEFVESARQLVQTCSEEALELIWTEVIENAQDLLPDTPAILAVQAELCHRRGDFWEERERWESLLSETETAEHLQHEAHSSLSTIYAPGGPLENSAAYSLHTLQAARTTHNTDNATSFYSPIITKWDWERLAEEIIFIEERENQSIDSLPPWLLTKWLRDKTAIEHADSIRDLLLRGDRYKRWPTYMVMQVLEELPYSYLTRQPKLVAYWLKAQTENGRQPSDPDVVAKFGLALMHNNPDLDSTVSCKVAELLFETIDIEKAEEIRREYLPDSKAASTLFGVLSEEYSPRTLTATARWLNWFRPIITTEDPDYDLELLQRVDQESGSTVLSDEITKEMWNSLSALTARLIENPDAKKLIHRIWLKACKLQPERLLPYMVKCLSSDPPETLMADDCLEYLLNQSQIDLPQLREVIMEHGLADRSERVNRALTMIGLLDSLSRQPIMRGRKHLSAEHFLAVLRVFKPMVDVHHADMAATLINYLRGLANHRWLTPISFYVQVLGYARRFEEAHKFRSAYPGLTIGPKRETPNAFLWQITGEVRDTPHNRQDYHHIVSNMTRDWFCVAMSKPHSR